MNCSDILSELNFTCREVAKNAFVIYTPFTLGFDGQVASFTVQQFDDRAILSDQCAALMHAEAHGVDLSRARLDWLPKALPSGITLQAGELIGECDISSLATKARDMVVSLLSLSHQERLWAPRADEEEPFDEEVRRVIQPRVGDRLKRRPVVTGASGHQLQLTFEIQGERPRYIQTVPYDNRLDWTKVYRALGKMLDVKNAGLADDQRIVIVEDAANDAQMDSAITLLAHSASVYRFSRYADWLDQLAA